MSETSKELARGGQEPLSSERGGKRAGAGRSKTGAGVEIGPETPSSDAAPATPPRKKVGRPRKVAEPVKGRSRQQVSDEAASVDVEPGSLDGQRVVYFDYSLRDWQKQALAALEGRRFGVIVAHRRAGKTEAVVIRLLVAAMLARREHPAPFYGYVAPFLNQAKAVAWDRLKFYARRLPGLKINESELTVGLWNGASIRLFGADYPDRLRGLGFDGVVMDEVAQMRAETWPAVVRPALSDRRGWAVFIGTPKGLNIFHDLYQTALSDPEWYAGNFTADRTGVIDPLELEKLRREMGAEIYRQEYLCDFSADAAGGFIDFQTVREATLRQAPPVNPAPLIFGLDVARYGQDRSALVVRRGRVLESLEVWRDRDLMYTASAVSEAINRLSPRAVFIDSVGLGAGVVDRLRQLGHRVLGVNSGARAARPDHFVNLKAEMWSKMRDWLQEEAVIPDRQDLKNDLLAPTYDFDHQGRLKIEGKDELKSRTRFSTDLADALALTFAQPVAMGGGAKRRPRFAEMD